ncbi:hypothetical protein CONLIGDRAFT_649931 [Coniochaeta ligniaria NRRL 30616]|uniref:Uncharacterized protein n=1 Tax=Coniochaeta ligniaria NRRL 30616 TaxID=1408157 RepID=A0A1J7J1R4_9PEZI|nr:hypothetical protein CONLIGDRAFT_649931 [Coniochaeta ligniaria NRRL 30616]
MDYRGLLRGGRYGQNGREGKGLDNVKRCSDVKGAGELWMGMSVLWGWRRDLETTRVDCGIGQLVSPKGSGTGMVVVADSGMAGGDFRFVVNLPVSLEALRFLMVLLLFGSAFGGNVPTKGTPAPSLEALFRVMLSTFNACKLEDLAGVLLGRTFSPNLLKKCIWDGDIGIYARVGINPLFPSRTKQNLTG